MEINTTVKLNNGIEMPMLGLGVFRTQEGLEAENAVRWALEAGYRHIDTAKVYGNEKSVGNAIRNSSVKRDEIFITTKLWNDDMRQNRQMEAFEESLELLGIDYVDLYLIHWPVENFVESWKVMEEIYNSGKAMAIGVSNFQTHHLDTLLKEAAITPAVNQFECHPYLAQMPLIEYCKSKGIICEAYSPLGGERGNVLADETIVRLAKKHDRTPAQIVLRWNLERGVIVIPKSIRQERIISNARLFDFDLSPADMDELFALNKNQRFSADPDNFNF